jgi:CBS domain-containing protein
MIVNTLRNFLTPALLVLLSPVALAEEVKLPVPFLEWSVYILLIFAVCVVIGISIPMKGRSTPGDVLTSLIDVDNPVVHSARPAESVTECVRRMNELGIGAMLVMENDKLLGIFTERDAMTRVLGGGLDPANTEVSAVMTAEPVCVTPATTLEEARNIVSNQRFRHLPVVEDGKVLGMVSSGDLTYQLVGD